MINTREKALWMVNAERDRQISLYKDPELTYHEYLGILLEEYFELGLEIGRLTKVINETRWPNQGNDGGEANILIEACHTAAVAVQVMERMLLNAGRKGSDTHAAAQQIERASRDNLAAALKPI